MQWTKENPTVPGYYWLRNYLFVEALGLGFTVTHEPKIVNLYSSLGLPLELIFCGNDCVSSLDDLVEAEWFGPLLPPTEGIDNWNTSPPRIANSNVAIKFRDLPDDEFPTRAAFAPCDPEMQPFDMTMAGGFVVSFSMKTNLKIGEQIHFWGKSYIVWNREEKDGFIRYSLTPEAIPEARPGIERMKSGPPTKTMIEDAGPPSTFVQDKLAEMIERPSPDSEWRLVYNWPTLDAIDFKTPRPSDGPIPVLVTIIAPDGQQFSWDIQGEAKNGALLSPDITVDIWKEICEWQEAWVPSR